MSTARAKFLTLRRPDLLPLAPGTKNAPEDLLFKGVRPALDALTDSGLAFPDVASRLAAIDFLEMLEDLAAPAALSLAQSLNPSQNRFVRWAAARTVGRITLSKITPASTRAAVLRGLENLLLDPDRDVRMAAVRTLQRFGPAASATTPRLIQAIAMGNAEIARPNPIAPAHLPVKARASLGGDPDVLLETILALLKVGTPGADETRAAVTALAEVLRNPDPRVRRGAAEALERFGAAAQSALPALRAALNDEDSEVRQAVSDALLNILQSKK
jgi:HEAT repeat protein